MDKRHSHLPLNNPQKYHAAVESDDDIQTLNRR